MSLQLSEVKKNCSYDPTDIKWVLKGGELLQYLGTEVMRVDFTREEKGDPEKGTEDKWTNKVGRSLLLEGKDFDPMTDTFVLVWKDVDYSKPEEEWEIKETRIFPIAVSYENPDEVGKVTRFIPYSLHTKKVETEAIFVKLQFLFDQSGENSTALPFEALEEIANSKDKIRTLGNVHNIAVVIKPHDSDNVSVYRLGDLYTKHQFKTVWKLTAKDTNGKNEITLLCDTDPESDKTIFEMKDKGKTEAIVKFFDLRHSFKVKNK